MKNNRGDEVMKEIHALATFSFEIAGTPANALDMARHEDPEMEEFAGTVNGHPYSERESRTRQRPRHAIEPATPALGPRMTRERLGRVKGA